MAMIATIEVRYWKEHECAACEAVYRYLVEQKIVANGKDAPAASALAEKKGIKAIAHYREIRPCPSCGRYQPDMIGLWRSRKHWLITLISSAAFAALFIVTCFDFFPQNLLLWAAAGFGAVTLIAHGFVVQRAFNKDLEANLALSRSLMTAGTLLVAKNGDVPADADRGDQQRGALPIFLLMLVPLLMIPAAEIVRLRQGWPFNPSWHPGVAGPGDTTYIWFPQTIHSVKGYWNGVAGARVLNNAELGMVNDEVPAESSPTTWPGQIHVKDNEKNTSSTLWARIAVPKVDEPLHKVMKVQIDLKVVSPQIRGNKFENVLGSYSHKAEIVLAEPGAGTIYATLWWLLGIGGAVCLNLFGLVLIFFFAHQLIRKARPNRIYTIDQPGTAIEPAEFFSRGRSPETT